MAAFNSFETPYNPPVTVPTQQALDQWLRHRRTLRRWFWIYLLITAISAFFFLRSFRAPDPFGFAILLTIPLICLRQAWKTDRQIVACDRHIRQYEPIIQSKENTIMTEKATFAAGCFWGVEEVFRQVPGVVKTQVGYTNGKTLNPTYKEVCTDRTGHAEAIEIEFDPAVVTYQHLLEVFFENHDPTTPNRQGPDVGTQYRSGVYFHSPEQQKAAEAEIDKRNASGDYARPVVTEVEPAATFYSAEDYHQRYFQKRGIDASCHIGNGKKAGRQKAAAH